MITLVDETTTTQVTLPTLDEQSALTHKMRTEPIAPREFVFQGDLIPMNELSLLPAFNGSGKSFLALQIAMHKAAGRSYMIDEKGGRHFDPVKEGRVLILSNEDTSDDYARRMQSIIQNFPDLDRSQSALEQIDKNLFAISFTELGLAGNLIMKDAPTGLIKPSPEWAVVRDFIIGGEFQFVVIDPYHYVVSAATENSNEEQGMAVGALIALAKETGTAILCPAHTSESNPLKVRGATSITDRARSVFSMATLARLYEKQVNVSMPKKSDLGDLPPSNVVRLSMTKNSHGNLMTRFMLFERRPTGVMVPVLIKGEQQVDFHNAVIEAIKSQPEGRANQSQIVGWLGKNNADEGKSDRTLEKHIKQIAESGYIEQVEGIPGPGKYYKVADLPAPEQCKNP